MAMENSSFHAYNLKGMNDEIQDLSFSEELPPLNRVSSVPSLNQYYYKSVHQSADIYNSNFSEDFSNDNFSNSLPSASTMFHQNETNNSFCLPENQSEEILLNSIELNDNDKLLLSNNLAMLTQGRQGPCLELVLNNGEVVYAIIDSDSDYIPSSPRLTLVHKDVSNGGRQFAVANETEMRTAETAYNNRLPVSSDFGSRSSTINFHESSPYYQTIIPEPLSKSNNNSSVNEENFNLCCNFPTEETHNFSCDIDSYQPIVDEKPSEEYPDSLLQNVPASVNHENKNKISSIQSNSKLEKVPSKIDYFPSAVHSIVVSETGKKYPKKYSFYSNNISSFLNQEPLEKSNLSKDNENQLNNNPYGKPTNSKGINSFENDRSNIRMEPEAVKSDIQIVSQRTNDIFSENSMSLPNTVLQQDIQSTSSLVDPLKSHQNAAPPHSLLTTFPFNHDENIKNKFLNSRPESVINNIFDSAVQSRARASLPSEYLSINRIRSDSNSKKIEYGVFARKMIPSRTLFGPLEGILIKEEDSDTHDNQTLQFTVESEDGKFFKLDVSNEDACNWMKFVRPATTYREQNLILSQRGSNLYYTTIEVIHPKQELLVWYSAWYAQSRNYKLLPDDPCAEIPYENIVIENDMCSTSPEQNGILLVQNYNDNEILSVEKPSSIGNIEQNDLECPEEFTVEPHIRENETCEEIGSASKKAKPSASTSKKCDKSKKSLWLCTYCDLTFSNASVMNIHILVHTADDVERTQSSELLSKNVERESTKNGEKYVCPQCNQEFSEKKKLILHVSKHGLKVQRWTCDKSIKSITHCDEHFNENDEDMEVDARPYCCDQCGRSFKNSVTLNHHKRFHSNVLECPVCEMKFQKLTDLRKHVHSHAVDGVFHCPHCQKKYDRYKYLRKHIRSCHSKVTFDCTSCKKSFKTSYKLKLHMLRHSDEKDFLCAICGKLFKRVDKLTEHVKSMHSEEREKIKPKSADNPIKVKKSFKKNVTSKVLRVVTENMNNYFYKCYVCNIGFKRRGMLVNHINLFHPDVNLDTIPELNAPIMKAYCDFYCPYCDKVYKSSSKRKQHMIKSHPGAKIPQKSVNGTASDLYAKHTGSLISNPFNCEFCHKQYASRAKLLGHHRRDHRDMLPSNLKTAQNSNARRNKKKTNPKINSNLSLNDPAAQTTTKNMEQFQNVEFGMEQNENLAMASPTVIQVASNCKETTCNVKQIINLSHMLNDELHNSSSQDQCLKILQSSNGISIAPTDENSTALLQQILTSYPFSSS